MSLVVVQLFGQDSDSGEYQPDPGQWVGVGVRMCACSCMCVHTPVCLCEVGVVLCLEQAGDTQDTYWLTVR